MKSILLPLTLILLSGCTETKEDYNNRQYWSIVSCDSGFSTGWVHKASIWFEVIEWQVDKGGNYIERKMLVGESCSSYSRVKSSGLPESAKDYDVLINLK